MQYHRLMEKSRQETALEYVEQGHSAEIDGILCAGLEIQRFDKIGTSQQIPRSVGCSGCWYAGGVYSADIALKLDP